MVVVLRILPFMYQVILAITGSAILLGMQIALKICARTASADLADADSDRGGLLAIIPAHNEGGIIRQSVRSVLEQADSVSLCKVLVIADRCTDDTARRAVEAGAHVLCREDGLPGKQHALTWTFDVLRRTEILDAYDIVLVLDADNVLAPGALRDVCRALDRADACQLRLKALNPTSSLQAAWYALCASWAAAIGTARQFFGLQGILAGTGMAFRVDTLRRVPFRCSTVTEDWEYTADLTAAGYRIAYLPQAVNHNESPDRVANGYRQRLRWTRGGWQVLRKSFFRVLPHNPELAWWFLVPVYNLVAATGFVFAVLSPGQFGLGSVMWTGLIFAIPAIAQGVTGALVGIGFLPVAYVTSAALAWHALFTSGATGWYKTLHGARR